MPCFLRQKQDICFSKTLFRWVNISQTGSGLWPLPDFENRAYRAWYAQPNLTSPSAHLLIRVVAESPVYFTIWQSGLYATAYDHATVL